MRIFVLPAASLSVDHCAAWSRLQRSDPALANPFFRPEFTQAVASERDDVEVVVWEQDDEPIGFLPFERGCSRMGKPVGSHISELQGAIARRDVGWSPQQVIRAAGLRAWTFDHLLATQANFAPYQYHVAKSAYLDLSQGFERFRASRDKASKEHLSKTLQKARKAARELGDVRLESDPANRSALMQLLAWKAEQCRRTNLPCMYGYDWVLRMFDRFLDCQTPDFSGALLSLYIGDQLAAVQFGFASAGVLHGTVLGYNPDLSKYSPGMILLIRIAQEAQTLGFSTFVLGKGDAAYKDGLASGYDLVSEGVVHAKPAHAPLYRHWFQAKHRLKTTRVRELVRLARRLKIATRAALGCSD